jgi:GT2 family glycosyltransferase
MVDSIGVLRPACSPDRSGHDRVAVVILTWNDGDLLDAAVRSALASEGVDVDVVVIDNGSDPPAVIDANERICLIRNEVNRGVAAARNQGAAATDAAFLAFVDSDARLCRDTLVRMYATLAASPDVALAAPVFCGQAPEASAGRAPGLARKLARVAGLTDTYASSGTVERNGEREVDFAIGACQLVRRDAFEQVEGLDEGFFYGPEDVDFCLRLRDSGWRVVQVGAAECHHPARRRNRRILTRRGIQHGWAVSRHLWRHRGFARRRTSPIPSP